MSAQPYEDVREHLRDEMAWIDRALEIAIERFAPPTRPAELEQFAGLLLGKDEVRDELASEAGGGLHPSGREASDWLRLRDLIDRRIQATIASGLYLPLFHLAEALQLDPFQERCLLLALAPELDRKYERVFAFLQDDITRKLPTVDLALSLFCDGREARWEAFESLGSGSTWRRLEILRVHEPVEGEPPLISRRLSLDDRVVRFLLGSSELDGKTGRWAEVSWGEEPRLPASLEGLRGRLRALLDAHFADEPPRSLVLHLFGPYGVGREAVASTAAAHLGLPILWVDLRALAGSDSFERDLRLTFREALLQPAAIGVRHFDEVQRQEAPDPRKLEALVDAIRTFSRLTFLIGDRRWTPIGVWREETFLGLPCSAPDYADRAASWEEILGDGRADADPVELASKFRFTSGQIRDAWTEARARHLMRAEPERRMDAGELHAACRNQASPNLGEMARRIEPVFVWNDIVLPAPQRGQLEEIAAHVRHARTVMGQWGFSRRFPLGRAVTALFSGGSGTGKTMAAEILANDLQLALYKIDLSGVVSKYIGETEKNLGRIFREAQNSNAILFFDEADALFGKRSEVKDSHDRYANIEVAYLLQRMEEYDGIVILATNLKKNMDEAFVRRMRFIIDLPFPGPADRELIWTKIFPERAPLSDDVDFGFLARKLKITGGNIKNISLRAAYRAVARGLDTIDMKCLIEAAKHELDKVGKLYTEEEFGEHAGPSGNGSGAATAVSTPERAVR